MQTGHRLQFACECCDAAVSFSVLDRENFTGIVTCPSCQKKYSFDNETLVRQLRLFEELCYQLHRSEEILGKSSIAIDVGSSHVKVPFNLLLTRLSSTLELEINGKCSEIHFRIEPVREVAGLIDETL